MGDFEKASFSLRLSLLFSFIALLLVCAGMGSAVYGDKGIEGCNIIGLAGTVFVAICSVILVWSPVVQQKGQVWSVIGAVAAFLTTACFAIGILIYKIKYESSTKSLAPYSSSMLGMAGTMEIVTGVMLILNHRSYNANAAAPAQQREQIHVEEVHAGTGTVPPAVVMPAQPPYQAPTVAVAQSDVVQEKY